MSLLTMVMSFLAAINFEEVLTKITPYLPVAGVAGGTGAVAVILKKISSMVTGTLLGQKTVETITKDNGIATTTAVVDTIKKSFVNGIPINLESIVTPQVVGIIDPIKKKLERFEVGLALIMDSIANFRSTPDEVALKMRAFLGSTPVYAEPIVLKLAPTVEEVAKIADTVEEVKTVWIP